MTKPETTSPQSIAEAAAKHVAQVVADLLHFWKKPAAPGDIDARECLMALADLTPFDQQKIDEHIQPIADAVCSHIRMRGVPHSFVSPIWKRDGATMLADSTASVEHAASGASYSGTVIVRVVVFEEPNHLPRVAVLWSTRFAAE